ncbi:hypothetical protein GOACH_15_00380 [Gordonia aichiensis NBRC 108223]|uniref:Transposase n=1 Tax=Gordonia aichiensis NBRC 108223 TaxID=1220583 RepID=L7KM29_9ACTN|nr:hypothetical protein GOACH_15_00380 [Gordonia aichiensis NBRC 108223]
MNTDDAKRLQELEDENAHLKKLVTNQALDIDPLKDLSAGNLLTPNRNRRAVTVLRERFGFLSVRRVQWSACTARPCG